MKSKKKQYIGVNSTRKVGKLVMNKIDDDKNILEPVQVCGIRNL